MLKHKENINEKLEKEINQWKDKCVETEISLNIEKKDKLSYLIKLRSQNDHLIKENSELENELVISKNEYEEFMRSMEDNLEEVIKKEEVTLRDLQEKNGIVSNELEMIKLKCEQFHDPNFIFMSLSNWDPFYLNKILAELNNHIHGR